MINLNERVNEHSNDQPQERDRDWLSLGFDGLSSATVERRIEEEGYNELPSSKAKSLSRLLLEALKEPMLTLLIACGAIYFVLGDRQEALVLVGFIGIIIGITVTQERKAENALAALRELSSPRALVLRSGEKKRISGREIVREDIVFVSEGDRVPADGKLLSGSNISTDESLLTGESIPVNRFPGESLYAGTTIVSGQGIMQVSSTGVRTELGKIGKSIQFSPETLTHLQVETKSLVLRIAWFASALCIFVVVFYGITRSDWLHGFLAGLSLAMAILPNELPAVLTIFLALGAWRMSQRRVLTRKLSAIENLGSATVLCVDKTGTLTLNRMEIQQLDCGHSSLKLSDLRSGPLPEEFHEILEYGILASRPDPLDPMEKAFHQAGAMFLGGTEHIHPNWILKKEYPLSTELLSISHAWNAIERGEYFIGAKGAPEAMIDLCHLDAEAAKFNAQKATEMAKQGLRVLGVAKAKVKSVGLPEKQHDFDFKWVGLVGLADPIRLEVPRSVKECHSAGVRVIMLTGDHPDTARCIASQIGIRHPDRVVTGPELQAKSAVELKRLSKEVNVFSRVSASQKLDLVNALKDHGEIVAMTGDGVNDAPALKNAHIGIAMGKRGSDVAREASAIVLLEDDFTSIVEAIRTGRRIFSNLQNAFKYLCAAHVPIAGISVLPILFKLPLVLHPIHIAFLHLIIEPACSIAFEAQPASDDIMRVPPRRLDVPLFKGKLFIPSLVQGTSVLVSLLLIFMIALYRGQGELDARALAFTTLIVSNLVLILMSRSKNNKSSNRIVVSSAVMLGAVLYIPYIRELFQFSTLHWVDLGICIGIGTMSVIWIKAVQRISLEPRSRAV